MKAGVCAVAVAVALVPTPAAQAAPPPNFPDFTGFAVVTDTHGGLYQGGTSEVVTFAAPDGVLCGIYPLGGFGNSVRCYGSIPGSQGLAVTVDPTASAPCDFGTAQLRSANPGVINRITGDCPSGLAGATPMAAGQKVWVGTTTCGVAAGNVTACYDTTDGGHGFVLQPAGSWSF
jgi:hypothetical protein